MRPGERRLILRAELIHDGQTVVAHTTAISESGVFVHTDHRWEAGERILVRLSFPQLVAPFELEAYVATAKQSTGVGDPEGVTLAFVYRSPGEAEQLLALLAKIDSGSDPVPKVANPYSDPVPKVASDAVPTVASWHDSSGNPVPKVASRSAYRILLVEDSPLIRELFLAAMRKHFQSPFVIDMAEDCEQGWALLRSGGYDLTIIDYFLPMVDGSKLVERVRGDSDTAAMPVVAISTGGTKARDAFLAAGADIYLDKPIVMRDLLFTLGRLTRG